MTRLRIVKVELQDVGVYATHELIVAYLIASMSPAQMKKLRAALMGIAPPLRGRHKRSRAKKAL